jgi:hypothetical protein
MLRKNGLTNTCLAKGPCAAQGHIKTLAFRSFSSLTFIHSPLFSFPPYKMPSNTRPTIKDVSPLLSGPGNLDMDTVLACQWWIVSIIIFLRLLFSADNIIGEASRFSCSLHFSYTEY